MASVLNRTTKQLLNSVNTPEYNPKDWIIKPDLSLVKGVDPKFWVIEGDKIRGMTDEEKDADFELLLTAQKVKYHTLDIEIIAFINRHYDTESKQSLTASWVEGVDKGYVNRVTLIGKVWTWVETIIDYYEILAGQIFGSKTLAELDKVVWDLTPFEETDPVLSVITAKKVVE